MTGLVTAGGWNCSGEKIRKTQRLLQYVPGIHVFPDRQKKINYKTGRNTGPTGCVRAYSQLNTVPRPEYFIPRWYSYKNYII